jgi:hypothetical protein
MFSRICGPPVLCGLVEQLRLAGILPRMEQARSSLLPPPRLLSVEGPFVTAGCDRDHVLHQRASTRACDGLHYEENSRVRVLRHDAPNADCHGATVEVCEGTNVAQCRSYLPVRSLRRTDICRMSSFGAQ